MNAEAKKAPVKVEKKPEPKELTITTMCMVGGKILRVGEKLDILETTNDGYKTKHGLIKKKFASV